MARGTINLTFKQLGQSRSRSKKPKAALNIKSDTALRSIPPAVRINVGHRNYNVAPQPSAAMLGQELQKVFQTMSGDMQWFTDQLKQYLPEDMEAALQPAFEKSQVYVPVDTGALKESGYLETEVTASGATVEIGYGRNGDPEYAIIVHEIPARHEAPTRDKFLEVAIDEHYNDMITILTDRVATRMGGQ